MLRGVSKTERFHQERKDSPQTHTLKLLLAWLGLLLLNLLFFLTSALHPAEGNWKKRERFEHIRHSKTVRGYVFWLACRSKIVQISMCSVLLIYNVVEAQFIVWARSPSLHVHLTSNYPPPKKNKKQMYMYIHSSLSVLGNIRCTELQNTEETN